MRARRPHPVEPPEAVAPGSTTPGRGVSNRSMAALVPLARSDDDGTGPPPLRSRPLSGAERRNVDRRVAAVARLWEGPAADQLTNRMATKAFTMGPDIVLSRSVAQATTSVGKPVLMHELTHVAQHRAGGSPPARARRTGARHHRIEGEASRAAIGEQLPDVVTPDRSGAIHLWEEPRHSAVHPVTEGPLESLPSELDPTLQLRLDGLVLAVEAELATWRRFRQDLVGGLPGRAAVELGGIIHDELYRDAANKDRIRLYLALKLGSTNLYLLREVLWFWHGEHIAGLQAQARHVGQLFGLDVQDPGHRYTIEGTTELSGKLGVGGSLGTARISYTNSLGMSFTVSVNMGNIEAGLKAKLKAPVGKAWRKLKKLFGKGKKGGGGGGGGGGGEAPQGVEVEVGAVTSDFVGVAGDLRGFWGPDRFGSSWWRPARFSVVDVGPKATAVGEVANWSFELGGLQYQIWKEMTFYSPGGRNDLQFNLSIGGTGFSASGPNLKAKKDRSLVPDLDVEAGFFSLGYGLAWRGGGAGVDVPDPSDPPRRRVTGQWDELLRSSVFFETGCSTPEPGAAATVGQIATAVGDFWYQYPDYDIRIEVTGHASPRWRHPKRGEIPENLNAALSADRAYEVSDMLGNAVRAEHTSGHCDFTITSCVGDLLPAPDPVAAMEAEGGVGGKGTFEAMAEGADPDDDWWAYRRVDIVVLRSRIGVATHEAGPLPPVSEI